MRFLLTILLATLAFSSSAAPFVNTAGKLGVVLSSNGMLAALTTNSDASTITTSWNQVSGPGTAVFSNSALCLTEAYFPMAGNYTIQFSATDHTGTSTTNCVVTVYSSPLKLHVMFSGTGTGTVNGQSSNYMARYSSSTPLTLTATASVDSTFIGWLGTYTGTNNPCTVTVDQTKDITAVFDLNAVATNLFYVATNGNDSASGRLGSPWLTLGHAASVLTNGSRVIVGQGEYNEYVTLGISGNSSLPIVFDGSRDTNGNWLSVIDPSTNLTSGWVLATEFATNGTYKYTGLPYEPKELEVDHRRVSYVFTNGYLGSYLGSSVLLMYTLPNGASLNQASNLFNMGSNDLAIGYNNLVRFWDGLEAIWCTSGGAPPYTCYIRFRNGDNPNGKNIRASRNFDGLFIAPGAGGSVYYPAVDLTDRSNIVIRNFLVRGAFGGVKMSNKATGDVVENNQMIGGLTKVFIGKAGGSGSGPNGNTIRNNDMRSDYYGYKDCGAWNTGGSQGTGYRFSLRKLAYGISKYNQGWGNTTDEPIMAIQIGDTNRIYGNHIHRGGGGDAIYLYNSVAPAANATFVWDNVIENQSSTGFIINSFLTNLCVLDNAILDCDINIRLGIIGIAGETIRYCNFFRNTSWLPEGIGQHFFFHGDNANPSTYFPTFWIYHNSFSGGQSVFDWNGNFPANGGMPNLHIVNNILSDATPFYFNTASMSSSSTTNVGDFAYNELVTSPHPVWYGGGNIDRTVVEWANSPIMDFTLTNGSPAINAAIDTSQSFTLQGINYTALPQDSTIKADPAWDIGAMEFSQAYYMDSSKTGTSHNTGLSHDDAWTNWVPLGGTDGQWTHALHGGDTLWIFPGTGYVGNRTGVPDAINMYNIAGVTNNPIIFKAVQTNGLVITPPLLLSGSFFTFDGRLNDNYQINFDNMENLYQITNNINWRLRGVYGFGSNAQNGIYCPNVGPQMKFLWLDVDPYTFNTNNYPYGNTESGTGANTHGIDLLQNTGESLNGCEIGYCYIHEADQCGIFIVNNNAPSWRQLRIHHNVITMVGDAGARLAGGFEVDHNIIGKAWTIHGHPNGVVQVPKFSLFHHNIVYNTLDTMFYTPGGGSSVAEGIKIYNNLFYTTKDWSFLYTNQFSSNKPFVNHSIGGIQWLVEANANNTEPWLPQIYTNFVFANNTMICGMGGQATNGNAGISSAVSIPNRYAPGNTLSVEAGLDRGFVVISNMLAVNNLIFNVSPSGSGQTIGGFQGWVDKFNTDTNTWTNNVSTYTAGVLFDPGNTNGVTKGSTNLLLDYNVFTANQSASKLFSYNGPGSTNTFVNIEAFNAAYTTNGYIHNSSTVPSLVDTNYYDFHPRVLDTVLVGKGTNYYSYTNAPGGLPQFNMDLSGVTRSTFSIGAYEPNSNMVLHLTFDDMYPATGTVTFATSPFTTDITGYGGTMAYYGFISTPTNWPTQVVYTNIKGSGYIYSAQFISNTNLVPAYNNFSIAQFGAITNIFALSNLSAITVSCWAKYYPHAVGVDNVATIVDTCEGSPGNGVTWSLGRNSAYQTSFDIFTNQDYNTCCTMHQNFPDNDSTNWHFYVGQFNTTNQMMYLYMDGTNCASKSFVNYCKWSTNIMVGVPSSGGSYAGKNGWISIGCRTHVGSPNLADGDQFPNNGWMDGEIYDLRVYNYILSSGDILALYNGGGSTSSGGGGGFPSPAANLIWIQGHNSKFGTSHL